MSTLEKPRSVELEKMRSAPERRVDITRAYEQAILQEAPVYVLENEVMRRFPDGVVVAIDAQGSTDASDKLKRHYDQVFRETQDLERVQAESKFANGLAGPVSEAIHIFEEYGALPTDQIGDGTYVILTGPDAEKRFLLAAKEVAMKGESKIKVDGEEISIRLRLTADLVRNGSSDDLVAYNIGNGKRRFAGLVGDSLDRVEILQKQVGNRKLAAKVSPRLQEALGLPADEIEETEFGFEEALQKRELLVSVPETQPTVTASYAEKFIPLPERKELKKSIGSGRETERARFRSLGIYFAKIEGFEQLVRAAANGSEYALVELNRLADTWTEAETKYGGAFRNISNGRALFTFEATREGLEDAKDYHDHLAGEHPERKITGVIHADRVIDMVIGHSKTPLDQSVNAAARISANENSGLVLVDSAYNLLTGDNNIVAQKRTEPYKGIKEVTYYVVSRMERTGAIEPKDLPGRSREIALTQSVLKENFESAKPSLLLVKGPQGMGKESVLEASANGTPMLSLETRGTDTEDPYAPFKKLVGQLLHTSRAKDQLEINNLTFGRLAQMADKGKIDAESIPVFVATLTAARYETNGDALSLDEKKDTDEVLADVLARLLTTTENGSDDDGQKILKLKGLGEFSDSARKLLIKLNKRLDGRILEAPIISEDEAAELKGFLSELSDEFGERAHVLDLEPLPYYANYDPDKEDKRDQEKWLESGDNKAIWYGVLMRALPFAERQNYVDYVNGKAEKRVGVPLEDTPQFRRTAVILSHIFKGNPEAAASAIKFAAEMGMLVPNEDGKYEFAEGKRISSKLFENITSVAALNEKRFEALDEDVQMLAAKMSLVEGGYTLEEEALLLPHLTEEERARLRQVLIEKRILFQVDEEGKYFDFVSPSFQKVIRRRNPDRSVAEGDYDKLLALAEDKDSDEYKKAFFARYGSHRNKWVFYSTALAEKLRKQNLFNAAAEKVIPVIENITSDEIGFSDNDLEIDRILDAAETYRLIGRSEQTIGGHEKLMDTLENIKEVVDKESESFSYDRAIFYLNLALNYSKIFRTQEDKERIFSLIERADEIHKGIENFEDEKELFYLKQKMDLAKRLRDFSQAVEIFEQGEFLLKNNPEMNVGDWITEWYGIAIPSYRLSGNPSRALDLCEEVKANYKEAYNAKNSIFAFEIRLEEGKALLASDPTRLDEAKQVLLEALAGYDDIYQTLNKASSEVLFFLGAVEMERAEYEESANYLRQAAIFYEKNAANQSNLSVIRISILRALLFGKADDMQVHELSQKLTESELRSNQKVLFDSLLLLAERKAKKSEILQKVDLYVQELGGDKELLAEALTNLMVLSKRQGLLHLSQDLKRRAEELYLQLDNKTSVFGVGQAYLRG